MSSNTIVRRLLPGEMVNFDCSDPDLTAFFNIDCKDYCKELLAVTYLLQHNDEILAMFSLSNDRLDLHDFEDDEKKLKAAARDVNHNKRGFKSFPAVKIARLAVKKGLEKKGVGRNVVTFIKALFVLKNKTGCRFLTVDSYPGAIGFYESVGFKRVKVTSEADLTPTNQGHALLYLDLIKMVDSPKTKEFESVVDDLLTSNKAEFNLAA